MKKNEFGVFEIIVPAKNGQKAIPHNSKIKVAQQTNLSGPTVFANRLSKKTTRSPSFSLEAIELIACQHGSNMSLKTFLFRQYMMLDSGTRSLQRSILSSTRDQKSLKASECMKLTSEFLLQSSVSLHMTSSPTICFPELKTSAIMLSN